MTRFQVVNEVCSDDPKVHRRIEQELTEWERSGWAAEEGWRLCLQWGRYIHGDGRMETGYRFIWRRPDGRLQAARGQARIPTLKLARILMDEAGRRGWGDYAGD